MLFRALFLVTRFGHGTRVGLTPELRHRHRNLTLAAVMISKIHGPVKTEGAVAVACSDLLAAFEFHPELFQLGPNFVGLGYRSRNEDFCPSAVVLGTGGVILDRLH